MIDHKKYTIDFIASIFNFSKYLVKKAHKWKLHTVGSDFPTKNEIKRNILGLYKFDLFLDFLFTSSLMQDVEYGIAKLKFDSSEIKILHGIVTAKYSHVISSYTQKCSKSQFEPSSEGILLRFLQ